MLDLYRLSAQISEKKEVLAKHEEELKSNVEDMFAFLNSVDRKKIQNVSRKFLARTRKMRFCSAFHTIAITMNFLKSHRCSLNTDYEVFAVDGSNTEIDRHILTPYYVLNIACVSIVYGQRESKFWYRTFPYIYLDQELYSDKDDITFKNSSEISQERQEKEFAAILEYVERSGETDQLKIVLYDGNLVDWSQG